jgi:hypothetical protein
MDNLEIFITECYIMYQRWILWQSATKQPGVMRISPGTTESLGPLMSLIGRSNLCFEGRRQIHANEHYFHH